MRFTFRFLLYKLQTKIMDNKEKVIKAYADAGEPLKAAQVAELSGVDKKEVDKIIKVLKAEETIYSPKRCFYQIK